jgi:hypothetical protein
MQIKKHIPNILTLLNLFSGCVALLYATQSNFTAAFGLVCLGIFFDFFVKNEFFINSLIIFNKEIISLFCCSSKQLRAPPVFVK